MSCTCISIFTYICKYVRTPLHVRVTVCVYMYLPEYVHHTCIVGKNLFFHEFIFRLQGSERVKQASERGAGKEWAKERQDRRVGVRGGGGEEGGGRRREGEERGGGGGGGGGGGHEVGREGEQGRRERLLNEQLKCGVATISRLLKIIGLFCKRAL